MIVQCSFAQSPSCLIAHFLNFSFANYLIAHPAHELLDCVHSTVRGMGFKFEVPMGVVVNKEMNERDQ